MQTTTHAEGRRVLISSRRQARRIRAARTAMRSARASVAAAFRAMAIAVSEKAAWSRTLAFWAPALQQV